MHTWMAPISEAYCTRYMYIGDRTPESGRDGTLQYPVSLSNRETMLLASHHAAHAWHDQWQNLHLHATLI